VLFLAEVYIGLINLVADADNPNFVWLIDDEQLPLDKVKEHVKDNDYEHLNCISFLKAGMLLNGTRVP